MREIKIQNNLQVGFIAFGIVTVILTGLFVVMQYAPFGNNGLTWADANIQYLDFFGYLKDVLEGKNQILYSFSKTLGGTNIAVFSYYLSSPFNFLVLFFEKENLHAFFHLLIILKLSLAAFNFSYFLNKRFGTDKKIFIIILSVGYALSQYSIAQSSNIMWLDGVYMLPLMLAAVYELIEKRVTWKLSITVGLSILFNWYTGGINCLFTIIWFLFELALRQIEYSETERKIRLKELFILFVKYGVSMALGVFLSAALFLPTIGALQNSTRGSLSLSMLFDTSFIGNVVSAIQAYSVGAQSQYGTVSLFCGTLALTGCIACFFSNDIKVRKKIVLGGMAVITILMFYWQPFFFLFSLLKSATSYWYRYSYCGIVVVLFMAATYFLTTNFEKNPYILIKISLSFSALLLILNYLNGEQDLTRIYYTVIFAIGSAFVIVYMIKSIDSSRHQIVVSQMLVFVFFVLEMAYGSKLQMNNYHSSDVDAYQLYVSENEQQIEELKTYDDGIYRVTQTSTRNMSDMNITANYNEALSNGYWSISGYTSSPDDIQRDFLDKVGYPINGENMCIVNTSILPADSLLGVKYVLSEYPINGLTPVSDIDKYNGKAVYKNPYCLPMAFKYEKNASGDNCEEINPFLYQKQLYSELLGEEIELFIPLDFQIIKGNWEESVPQTYKVNIPEGEYAIYGNLPSDYSMNAILDVNQIYQTEYSCWLSPSVFYIPTRENENYATITIKANTYDAIKEGTEQFYALDLQKLKYVTEILSEREAECIEIENGYAHFEVDANENENLYISIPYDSGWTIILNGEKIQASLFGECFYSIPLQDGKNIIEMKYEVEFLKMGIIMSVLGVIGLVIIYKKERRKN